MNIELQCCALFIMVVVFIMFMREKRLDLMNRVLFIRAVYACFACLVFDIFSVAMIYETTTFGTHQELTMFVCRLYIAFLVTQGYFSFLYSSISMFPHDKIWAKVVKFVYHISFIAGIIAVFILPISYHRDDRLVYSSGKTIALVYCMVGFYILSTIVISLIYRKKMSMRRFMAMMIWQGTWLLAGTIQYFHPEILLVSFASAFGMLILYIQLENPSTHVDSITGLFTQGALSLYLHDKYKFEVPFSMFVVKIHYFMPSVDYNVERDTVMYVANRLVGLGKEPVFRLGDDIFCVVYDNEDSMREGMRKFQNTGSDNFNISARGLYIAIPDSKAFTGADELFKYIHLNENSLTGTLEVSPNSVDSMRDQYEVQNLITEALLYDRVVVYYQPFYNVKKGKFTAAEALVRIKDSEGNIVPPGKFIPVAEENGQIIQLGIKIFEKVCQFLSTGEAQAVGLEYVEVNVSAAQFDFDNPAKFVTEYMEKYNIDSKNINLEVTETASNDNKHILLKNMDALIGKGITFSLDDFGTGRSNLDYFVNMPVKNIKFDYSFTQGYFANDKLRHVFEGMIHIMHNMGMTIISEGVETREQAQTMANMGVEYIQGFYFSKPIPSDEFLEFLRKHNS